MERVVFCDSKGHEAIDGARFGQKLSVKDGKDLFAKTMKFVLFYF
jgi:hypothetical protein